MNRRGMPPPRLFIGGREIAIDSATLGFDCDAAKPVRAEPDARVVADLFVPSTVVVQLERVYPPKDETWRAMVLAVLGTPRRQRRMLARAGTVGRRGAARVARKEVVT